MEPTEAIREYAERKLLKVKRYLDEPIESNVVLSIEKYRNIADVTLSAGRNVLNCKEETDDIYSAIDKSVDKLERQVKKQKEKTRGKKGRGKPDHDAFVAEAETADVAVEQQPEWEKRIAATEVAEIKPIGLEEAVIWMDSHATSDLLVFTDSDNRKIHVLYRRKDGDLGLILAGGE
jgi:putative sigma-54 modulation protein